MDVILNLFLFFVQLVMNVFYSIQRCLMTIFYEIYTKYIHTCSFFSGDDLVNLLKCLCKCIQATFLNDYFLREKNLLQNSGSGSLYFSLKQLSRIIENPVMYVLHAMENIRYKSNFFPKLKSEELLKILTVDELLLINPNLENKINTSAPKQDPTEDNEIYNERRGRFWDDAKKKKDQFVPNRTMLATNKTLINPSKAHDSVVDISVRMKFKQKFLKRHF